MSKPDQIAHRAREVSSAKTNLLRVVVSERMSSNKQSHGAAGGRSNDTGKFK